MVTTDQRVEFTTAFIKNHEIKDDDMKQDLYLVAIETEQGDEPDYAVFARMVSLFDKTIKEHEMRQQIRNNAVSIGVCKAIPLDIAIIPDNLESFLRLLAR